jgi:hypothetical protein
VWDESVVVLVNDTQVALDQGRGWRAWGPYFGLGGFNKTRGAGFNYKGLKVTVLKEAPEWIKELKKIEEAPVDMAPERRRGPRF